MESIIYELRANDIKEEDIEIIMEKVKNRISEENIDYELQRLGYEKIFTVDYDSYDIDSFSDYSGYNDEYEMHNKPSISFEDDWFL